MINRHCKRPLFTFVSSLNECTWEKIYKNWRINPKIHTFLQASSHETEYQILVQRWWKSLFSFGPKRRQQRNWISNNDENKHFFSTPESDTCITIIRVGVLSSLIPEKNLLKCNRNFFWWENKRRKEKFPHQRHNVFHVFEMPACDDFLCLKCHFRLLSRIFCAVKKRTTLLTLPWVHVVNCKY